MALFGCAPKRPLDYSGSAGLLWPSTAEDCLNCIEIGQSSNWLRTDRGTSLNVGGSTRGRSGCHESGAAVARGTCDRAIKKPDDLGWQRIAIAAEAIEP
jgi:hypothetical protein